MDKSDLYVPPKDWQQGAEAWYEQVEFVIRHTREQIAQDILEWAQKYNNNPIVENCVRIARGK